MLTKPNKKTPISVYWLFFQDIASTFLKWVNSLPAAPSTSFLFLSIKPSFPLEYYNWKKILDIDGKTTQWHQIPKERYLYIQREFNLKDSVHLFMCDLYCPRLLGRLNTDTLWCWKKPGDWPLERFVMSLSVCQWKTRQQSQAPWRFQGLVGRGIV